MLASPDPQPLLDAALGLIEAAEAEGEDFPQLRAGAALGAALPRAGDWFGRPVNIASRVTVDRRPGSLLVEGALHEPRRESYRCVVRGRAAPSRDPRAGGALQGATLAEDRGELADLEGRSAGSGGPASAVPQRQGARRPPTGR